MKKAIIYLRKSTDRDDKQKLSIEGQREFCLEICSREGFDVLKIIEDKKTAKEPGREGFAEMIQMITRREADVVIVWEMSRIARNPIDSGSFSWCLQNHQIEAVWSKDGVFKSTDNVVMLSIHFGIASQFIIDLRKNVLRGMYQKLAMGGVVQKAPFGYRLVNKELIVHEGEARIVKKAYKMRAERATYEEITKMFRENGYKKPDSAIELILKNTFYYGMMKFAGEFFQGNYEPLVTQKRYDEVKDVSRGIYESVDKENVFFHGMVVRHEDKKPLCSSFKKGKYVYYHEHSRDTKKTQIRRSISQEYILKALDEIFEGYSITPEQCTLFRKEFYRFTKGSIDTTKKERAILQRRKTELENDNDGLTKIRAREEITSEEFIRAKNKNLVEIKTIQENLAGITDIDDEIMTKFDILVELLQILSSKYKTLKPYQQGYFIRMLVVELSVDKENTLRIKQKEPFQTLFSRNISFGGPSEIQVELFISLVEFLTNDLEVFRRAVLDPRNSLTKR